MNNIAELLQYLVKRNETKGFPITTQTIDQEQYNKNQTHK